MRRNRSNGDAPDGVAALLRGRITVLSAHLDDAVFSVGGSIAWAARRGASVTVLTVLAGDPESIAPSGTWDRLSGFATAGEAARVRRQEDRRACRVIGATPAWLPFGDQDYARGGEDDAVWEAILRTVEGSDLLLLPGFPLVHPDHRWLAELALSRAPTLPKVLYAEQPSSRRIRGPARIPDSLERWVDPSTTWEVQPLSPAEKWAKLRAFRCYRSQLPRLSRKPFLPLRVALYEALRGGETLAPASRTNDLS